MEVLLGLAIVAWMTWVSIQAIRATPAAEPDEALPADAAVRPEAAPDRAR